jgi:hypothetical protein
VPLIGLLEQFNVANVLQRVEIHGKTGLLTFRQGEKWVEFYFREGRLMCIGPLRSQATLAQRLVQDAVIPMTALQETMLVLGSAQPTETRIALTLMDLGHVSHDALRGWSAQKAIQIIQVLMGWNTGEIHFEEQLMPPADRLLVALSISSLLTSMTTPSVPRLPVQNTDQLPPAPQQPASKPVLSTPLTPPPPTHEPTVAPQQIGADQLLDMSSLSGLFSSTDTLTPVQTPPVQMAAPETSLPRPVITRTLSQPLPDTQQPVIKPASARSAIDVSVMRPEMVLVPGDFSALHEQNPLIQLTPDQWRLLTKVDGRTSLQIASQELVMHPERICQVAGELIATGLIRISAPLPPQEEMGPISRELAVSALDQQQYVGPGYAATASSAWAGTPNHQHSPAGGASSFSLNVPFETESQWGNGGNGATFVPGRGWIASPQSSSAMRLGI